VLIFTKIGEMLTRITINRLAFLLFFIVMFKTGISPIGSEYVKWIRDTAKTYPEPIYHLVSSPLPILLMKVFRYPDDYIWWAIGSAIYLGWILLAVKLILKRYPNHQKEALLVFFSSVPVATAATMMGHIDVYTLIGATIAVLSNFRFRVFVGALFSIGGNSDQALATLCCLTLLALGGSRFARKYLWQWALVSISAYLMLHLNVSFPSTSDPKQVMLTDLQQVLPTTLGSWHLLAYSQMGLLWIPWLLIVLPTLITRMQMLFTILGAIVLPLGLTMFILDGTRIGTTVGFICLLITLDEAYQNKFHQSPKIKSSHYGVLFLIFVITPSIVVQNQGLLRLPIRKILEALNFI
jgi:hypothetical protein